MNFLYNSGIILFGIIIKIAAFFNYKANKWVKGRKGLFSALYSIIDQAGNKKILWFHCASLGEFEQGRPLIERFKKEKDIFILLSFFSPSGYEIRKNYKYADYVTYLPLDTPANAKKWIDIINPQAAFFIKYEFWFNYIYQLKNRNIPLFLVSGIFRSGQIFFKPWGGFFRNILSYFDMIFLQNNSSFHLVNSINYNSLVTGDTRFDRVWQIANNQKDMPEIEKFKNGKTTFIAGSTWPADHDILKTSLNNYSSNIKFIIAPHEVKPENIKTISQQFDAFNPVFYTNLKNKNPKDADLFVIDRVGFLSAVYKYADIAYVGGAFGSGLHNILEPAVYGIPLIIGPYYKKFTEAVDLVNFEGAFSVKNKNEFSAIFDNLINNEALRVKAGKICRDYIERNRGATDIIYRKTENVIKLN